ncbi:hypothetical protein BDZ89DRAFT_450957 [Hymenopellis radicata]|nr:hypothetical protein BDZ89DRAFT_450957 [Hymenopellis radicata]
MNTRFTVLAIDILVIAVLRVDGDDVEAEFGSVYVDLAEVLCDVSGPGGVAEYTHTVVMGTEFEHLPLMQLTCTATSFSLSHAPHLTGRDMQHLILFEMCTENVEDADFKERSEALKRLLYGNTSVFLVVSPEQFIKVRDRCLSMTCCATCPTIVLSIYASLFNDTFRATCHRRMYMHSRALYQDFAAAVGFANTTGHAQYGVGLGLKYLPDTDPTKALRIQSLGTVLFQRYHQSHDKILLEQSIILLEAVEQLRLGAYAGDFVLDQFCLYRQLYLAYHSRFKLLDNVADLDMALAAMSKAIELQAPWWGSPQQLPEALKTFADGLIDRFMKHGTMHDLDRAMECVEEALLLVPPGSPLSILCLHLRVSMLALRFEFSKDFDALEQAITCIEELLDTVPSDHPTIPENKFHLAHLLTMRSSHETYNEYQNPAADALKFKTVVREQLRPQTEVDLQRAIDTFKDLLDSFPDYDPDPVLLGLGIALLTRFGIFGTNKAELDESIAVLSCVRPSTTMARLTLGEALYNRYIHFGREIQDLHSALSTLSDVAQSPSCLDRHRFSAASLWAEYAEELTGEDSTAIRMTAFKTAMSILPDMVWMGKAMEARHNLIRAPYYKSAVRFTEVARTDSIGSMWHTIGNLPSVAAAFAIQAGQYHTAIEWLEQGRSIVWDQLLQFRVSLDDLKEADPDLAGKLEAIARELVVSSTLEHSWVAEEEKEHKVFVGQNHRELIREWEVGVAAARKVPGFEKFLRPKDFAYLSRASETVVIISLDLNGSNALILSPGDEGVVHVPLPAISFQEVEFMRTAFVYLAQEGSGLSRQVVLAPFRSEDAEDVDHVMVFKHILKTLWYKIVQPIINVLMDRNPDFKNLVPGKPRTRVQWYPTGPLALLPLHAAGDYSKAEKGHRVFDFVVSSYIPTLDSIVRHSSLTSDSHDISVLTVECSSADIPGTKEEVRCIGTRVAAAGLGFTSLTGRAATLARVVAEMQSARWAHFACHGVQDKQSANDSALLLAGGGRLPLSTIATLSLPRAELAFLSACQTAQGYDGLPSESAHLAAGMLLAGYRGVIATMWAIEDRHAPLVADGVYGYLLREEEGRRADYREAAVALHVAVGG